METYVIRIYRRDRGAVTGVVESTDGRGSWPFGSLEELRTVLEKPLRRAPRRRRRNQRAVRPSVSYGEEWR